MSSTYGWVITKDHLVEPHERGTDHDATGTMGPSTLPENLREALEARRPVPGQPRHVFRMYDDDGILYYTGMGTWQDEGAPGEEALVGPLRDFGTPNAGAVRIDWQGHPEWTCEWC